MKRLQAVWLECFIPVLFLLNGVLLFPGTQSLRFAIRATPYAASLAGLALFRKKSHVPFPPGALPMALTLVLLALNLLHPHTQVAAGVAQVVFQAAIVGPVFWASRLVDDERRLVRLLWIVFGCNAVGSLVGILQIYFPAQFLPAEFSSAASSSWLRSVTFQNGDGQVMVRPPGLSDLPGGAAVSGSITAVLGMALSAKKLTSFWLRLTALIAGAVGAAVLFLTQIRSLTLMTLLALLFLASFGIRRSRLWDRRWMVGAVLVLVLGSFGWAVAAGGEKIRDRFLNIDSESFDRSRGWFWKYTVGEGLASYPLGAGLGRWGMMGVYFGDPERPDAPPLWAEIQATGWLYDGGVPLWLLYGTGLAASMLFLYRISRSQRYGHVVPFAGTVVFCLNASVIGTSFSGPSFNTTFGLQYWLLLALVYGAARKTWQPALLL